MIDMMFAMSISTSVVAIIVLITLVRLVTWYCNRVFTIASLRLEIIRVAKACYLGLGFSLVTALAKIWVPGGYFLPAFTGALVGTTLIIFETAIRQPPSIWHHKRLNWAVRFMAMLIPIGISGVLPQSHILALLASFYFGLRFVTALIKIIATRLNMINDLERRIVGDEAVRHNAKMMRRSPPSMATHSNRDLQG